MMISGNNELMIEDAVQSVLYLVDAILVV